jgi:hypothetical protein
MAYSCGGAMRWMLVRTPASVLLFEATGFEAARDADRGLCTPNLWHQVLEVTIPPTALVRENVLVGDPPSTIDCGLADEGDGRCTG